MSEAGPPAEIALFPIRGCILAPREHLPLNVFEPRYLNMVDDARAGAGHIGVVQPRGGEPPERPPLYDVGTLGRIERFSETGGGRYLIVLSGVTRFRIADEIESLTPYRVARTDYAGFEQDRRPGPLADPEERERFIALLRRYCDHAGLAADWDSLQAAPLDRIVDKTAMTAPFDPEAKQALLEAPDAAVRLTLLTGMLNAALDPAGGGSRGGSH